MTVRGVVEWRRGTDLDLVLRVKEGTVAGTETLRVDGKAVKSSQAPYPPETTAVAFSLTAEYAADVGDGYAGWNVNGTKAKSLTLDAGFYLIDAVLDLDSDQSKGANALCIEVTGRITGDAP